MPNHIYNVVHFDCNEEKLQEILEAIQHDHFGPGSIDFNKLIPMPDDVYQGNLGSREMNLYPGTKNWYGWSVENWGTKWPAYGFEDLPQVKDGIVFNTAWSSVPRIVEKISEKFPDVRMEYCWADEDFGSNTGLLEFKGGAVQRVYIPEDRTNEAFRFAAAVQGADIREFGYRENPETGDVEFDESLFMDRMPAVKPRDQVRER